MNNERETKTITTPFSKVEVVIKTYLTGREKRDIANSSMPASINYDADAGLQGLNPIEIVNNGEDQALRSVVVSIGGQVPNDVVDTVLNMHSEDSDFVISEVKKVVNGLTEEKKTI